MNKKIVALLCFLLLFVAYTASAQTYIISTIAGNGGFGDNGDGKLATDATLSNPWDCSFDKNGILYLGDFGNNQIRTIDTNGIIATVAGPGSCFCVGDGGPAKAAYLGYPTGVVIDTSGNFYFTDSFHARVRKVNKNGIISTIAGTGTSGFSGDGGRGDSAMITFAYGIALDDTGNVYFTDIGNNRVRKINKQGIITTFAGNGNTGLSGDGGQAVNAAIWSPTSVAVDKFNNVFISQANSSAIRKVDKSGVISTVAGNGTNGYNGDGILATSAQINAPYGVAVDDSGNIYIAEYNGNRIRKVNANGIITTIAGTGIAGFSGDNGLADSATMKNPRGLTVSKDGSVYFADYNNSRIRKLSLCSPKLKFTPSLPHVCLGQSLPISLAVSNIYTWAPSTGLNKTNGPAVVASPTVTTTYTITGTNCAASGTLVVVLDTFPIVKVSPASKTVCEGQRIPLSASGGNLTYNWSPAKGLNGVTGSSVMATAGFNTTYTVVGSNGYCASKDSVALTIGNRFQPGSIGFSADSVCPGTTEKITVSNSLGAIQLQASDSLGHFNNIAGATGTTYSFSTTKTTYYRILATNNSCTDTSVEYKLNILPTPSVSFIFNVNGSRVNFASTPGGGVVRYSWDFGDGEMSNDSNPVHTYATGKLYNVCLTVNNGYGCSFTTCNHVAVGANGIENIAEQANWNIYPNPTDGQLTFELNNLLTENSNITLTDMLGRVVYSEVITGRKSLINLSGLPFGAYFIHFYSGNISDVRKLIKN